MTRRWSLLVILVSMLVIGAGYTSAFLPAGAPRAATFAFALATAALMTAIITLGAGSSGKPLGRLRWVFAFTFVTLAAGFCLALTQTAVNTERLYFGLPAGAAIILYVVGLLPMIVLPVAYALSFERTTLNDAELAELRRQLAQAQTRDNVDGVQ